MTAPAPSTARRRWGAGLTLAGFLITALALYASTLGHEPVVDDFALVTNNPNLASWRAPLLFWTQDMWSSSGGGEPTEYYRPLAMLSFWLNAQLGGATALSVRIGNVLLHGLNAWLLGRIIKAHAPRNVASILALAWLALPLNGEAVIWLSGRFDLLAATLALTALLANRGRLQRSTWSVPLLLAAALTSKENVLGWMPVLILDDLAHQRRRVAQVLPKYVGIAAIIAAYLCIRWRLDLLTGSAFSIMGLATISDSYINLVATFTRLLLVPNGFSPFHLYQRPSDAVYVATGTGLVVVTCVVAWTRIGSSRVRGANGLLLGWGWFLASLAPTVVTGPLQGFFGDRFAYLPVMGLVVGFAALTRLRPSAHPKPRLAILGTTLIALVTFVQGMATVRRGVDWRTEEALSRAATRSDPDNWYAWYMVGARQARDGRPREADANLHHALSLRPGEWRTLNALCYLRLNEHRLEQAHRYCAESLAANPTNPRTWVNLASVQVAQHRWRSARAAASQALAIKPRYPEAHYLVAVSAANEHDFAGANRHLRLGLALDSTHAGLRDLATQLRTAGHLDPADPLPP